MRYLIMLGWQLFLLVLGLIAIVIIGAVALGYAVIKGVTSS